MRVNKYITPEEELDAINQKITFAPNRQIIKAPHFVMFVKEKLIEEFGEETVLKGGLSITTTLDMDIQKMAEKVVVDELEKVKKLRVSNAAVVITNPKTGEILAMVGSRDYFNTDGGGNVNVTTRPRQPGSSIKVINYALGLSNGLTLASIIDDSPITFSVPGLPPYSPKNYDGTYRGKITIRQALAESRNIPAVKILASYGVDKMIDLGQKMGITTWGDRSRFGLSLTLGGGETKLIDMAQVYGVIANMGTKSNLKYIKDIHTENDNQNVLDPRVAFLLIDVLRDNNARSRAFGTNSMLVIPNHPEVAVKTGTSNDLKDNLTIGFNQDYLVAVWVGNNDGSSMARIASGITGAAPIWNRIMTSLTFKTQSKSWPIPKGLIYKECYSRFEWFLEEKQIDCPKILDGISTTSD
jgi:membrane carboxypeptidase/penicillin-binding protein PbpC